MFAVDHILFGGRLLSQSYLYILLHSSKLDGLAQLTICANRCSPELTAISFR